MNSIALLGGGGHASDVLSVLEAISAADEVLLDVVVADDNWTDRHRFDHRNVKLIDSIDEGARHAPFLVSIGYPKSRRAVHERVVAFGGLSAPAIVHPQSSIGTTTGLDEGVVVMGQVWISAGVRIGRHVHIGYGTTVGHDTEIGPFSAVMPSASISGDVSIGEGVLVGTNATILQGLSIGDGATVGAGAVVTRDVEPGITVVGSPARRIETTC